MLKAALEIAGVILPAVLLVGSAPSHPDHFASALFPDPLAVDVPRHRRLPAAVISPVHPGLSRTIRRLRAQRRLGSAATLPDSGHHRRLVRVSPSPQNITWDCDRGRFRERWRIGDSFAAGSGDNSGNRVHRILRPGHRWAGSCPGRSTARSESLCVALRFRRGVDSSATACTTGSNSLASRSTRSTTTARTTAPMARTAAQIEADLVTLWRMPGREGDALPVHDDPRSNSTDSWATVGNQTQRSDEICRARRSEQLDQDAPDRCHLARSGRRGTSSNVLRMGRHGAPAGYLRVADTRRVRPRPGSGPVQTSTVCPLNAPPPTHSWRLRVNTASLSDRAGRCDHPSPYQPIEAAHIGGYLPSPPVPDLTYHHTRVRHGCPPATQCWATPCSVSPMWRPGGPDRHCHPRLRVKSHLNIAATVTRVRRRCRSCRRRARHPEAETNAPRGAGDIVQAERRRARRGWCSTRCCACADVRPARRRCIRSSALVVTAPRWISWIVAWTARAVVVPDVPGSASAYADRAP